MNAKQEKPINANCAGIEQPRRYQPRALLFTVLAALWVFPSAGAVFILWPGFKSWGEASGGVAILHSVTFEQWIAWSVLLLHPFFWFLAVRFRKTELPRELDMEVPLAPEGCGHDDPDSKF